MLVTDLGCCKLGLHEMLEALVDVSSAICLTQVPHVLLHQGLLVPLYHHAGETGRTCVVHAPMCAGFLSVATFNLPLKPVESNSAQKGCTCLGILWIKAIKDNKLIEYTAGRGDGGLVCYIC